MRWVLPGDEHRALATLAGDWTLTVALPGAPGRAPTVMGGKATARSTVGDRFVVIEGRVTGERSETIETMIVLGFDGRAGEYTYIGFDSFGTYYVTAAGAGDLTTGAIELEGRDVDSSGGTKHFTVHVSRRTADELDIAIRFQNPSGGSFTVMESKYRRAPKQ